MCLLVLVIGDDHETSQNEELQLTLQKALETLGITSSFGTY